MSAVMLDAGLWFIGLLFSLINTFILLQKCNTLTITFTYTTANATNNYENLKNNNNTAFISNIFSLSTNNNLMWWNFHRWECDISFALELHTKAIKCLQH